MKGFLITFSIILVAGAGIYLGWHFFGQKSFKLWTQKEKTLVGYSEPFQWGVTMNPTALGPYEEISHWQQQIDLAKKLGVKWVRINWTYAADENQTIAQNDKFINPLIDNGLGVLLVIDINPQPTVPISDYYEDGYKWGFQITSHYKGKIRFYQLMNNPAGQCLKDPNANGQNPDQYDPQKYDPVKKYLQGLAEGIEHADPESWRIVSISTQTGFTDKIVADGIKFDILGLDWFDSMGQIETLKMENNQLFMDKLKSYNKPLIITQTNTIPKEEARDSNRKTVVNETVQADFIQKMAQWAWTNQDYVKGFYVFELLDNINVPADNVAYYGLVKAVTGDNNFGTIGDPRKAFTTYQDLIKKYLNP